MLKFKLQLDQGGQFRIVGIRGGIYQDVTSEWTHYRGIAKLVEEGRTYIAVTAYYEGIIPHEKVMEIKEPYPTTLEEVERVLDENKKERVFVRSPLTAVSD